MSSPRTFDHDAARECVRAGMSRRIVARHFGVGVATIKWLMRDDVARRRRDGDIAPRCNQRIIAALGVDGKSPVSAARAAALSARIHALRAKVRAVGPICVDSLTIAAAHASGLTLEDIRELFAVPPAEAARAIALHAGR